MRKFLCALVVVATGALAGCSIPPYDPGSAEKHDSQKKIVVISYAGRNLFCLEQAQSHGVSYTCDFEAYYNSDSPQAQGVNFETAKVELVDMPYRGHTLHCFAFDPGHGWRAYTCDFVRFYRENQGADLPPMQN